MMRLKCFHEPIDDADVVVFLGASCVMLVFAVAIGFALGVWFMS